MQMGTGSTFAVSIHAQNNIIVHFPSSTIKSQALEGGGDIDGITCMCLII